MEMDDLPSLRSVKPASKVQLRGESALIFENCLEKGRNCDHLFPVFPHEKMLYIDDVLSVDECNRLCEQIDTSDRLSFWCDSGRQDVEARKFRDADTIEVNSTAISNEIFRRIEPLIPNKNVNIKKEDIDADLFEKDALGVWNAFDSNQDLLFARYPSYGSFAPHTDGRAIHNLDTRSFYTIVIYLKDIGANCGGGTRFFRDDAVHHLVRVVDDMNLERWTADSSWMTYEVIPKVGRLLIFDQSLVHEGVPPIAPYQKYIIRSDLMYRRDPPILSTESDHEAYRLYKLGEEMSENGQVEEAVKVFKRAFRMCPMLETFFG